MAAAGLEGHSGDGGPVRDAQLHSPKGMVVDGTVLPVVFLLSKPGREWLCFGDTLSMYALPTAFIGAAQSVSILRPHSVCGG